MPAIEARDIEKRFGDRLALGGVSLRVHRGEIVALLGPNGAGKSTLLRALAGMIVPDSGSARIAGHDVHRSRAAAARATGTMLGGEITWYPRLSGRANLEFFGVMQGLGADQAKRAAADGLAQLGLEEHGDRPVSAYSRGMRARLALARARLANPPVLLLDEPSGGLDARAAADLVGHLRHERSGRAVLFASHSEPEVTVLAHRALLLEGGRMLRELAAPLDAAEVAAAITTAAT